MTEVVNLIEDIISDEYEEGEILDEDILYENVSSLEEFSDPDDKKSVNKVLKSDVKRLKNRRRKEHKCKDDSVCRKERSGKHCYARIRKRSSLDSKSKNSSAKGLSSDVDKKPRPASARPVSPTRGSTKRDSFNKETTKGKGKQDDRGRYPPYYFQHDNRDRANPPRRNTSDRRPARTRRFSADDRRENDRKRKSRSPSPRSAVKHLNEASRVVAKTSLLDRLVGSGSIPQKRGLSCESDDCCNKSEHATDAKQQAVTHTDSSFPSKQDKTERLEILKPLDINEEPILENTIVAISDVLDAAVEKKYDAACQIHNLCPEDIPVPPTPKATSPVHEPPREEIDELHLRLVALKTAIMKKQNDFKRKKRLAASKKSFEPGNDSFTEFALMGIGDDECESIPTPPPPGTDSWPAPTIRDLDDPRWSDEDMVIDQESNYGDTIIEANIPASDPSLQNYVRHSTSASSQDKLPCCKGNPIPVVSPHRPAKEIEERRPALSSSTSVIIPVQEITAPAVQKETPKYLKEINSNLKSGMKRRRTPRGPRPPRRRRRNSIRRRTPVVRRVEKSIQRAGHHREPVARRSKVFEGDDDEDALRQLALMSVKPKNTITGGMLAKIGENLNPLHIETDPVALEIKPESPAKNPSPAEAWEDIDEDILRAQLLSSLTRNIPVAPSQPSQLQAIPVKRVVIEHNVSLRKDVLTKRLNKENLFTKRNVIVHPNSMKSSKRNSKKYINPNVKASLTPPLNPPVVEKFIIKVSESDTSEDDEKTIRGKIVSDFESAIGQKLDIESSIDKLLEEARKETELIQKATPYYPMYDVCPEALKVETTSPTLYDVPKQEVKSELPSPVEQSLGPPSEVPHESPVATRENEDEDSQQSPQGTSHLPAWQQEEFERQKRIMAQKERFIAAAKEKVRAKNCLAAGSASEEYSSKLCNTSENVNPPSDIEKDKTDGVIPADDTKPTTADTLQVTEETSDGLDSKAAAGLSSLNNSVEVFEPKGESVKSDDEDPCIQNEVKSCLELMVSKICAEIDTVSPGSCGTSSELIFDAVASDSSKSEAVPSNDTEMAVGIISDIGASKPIISSESSQLQAAEISPIPVSPSKTSAVSPSKTSAVSPLKTSAVSPPKTSAVSPPKTSAVSPSKTLADAKLLVSCPAVTKVFGNVASSGQGPSPQQQKKILQNRISEFYKIYGVSSKNSSRTAVSPAKVVAKSPARGSANPTVQPKTQPPVVSSAKQLVSSLPNGVSHSAVNKPLFAVKDSSYAIKGLNEMTDLVAGLEKGMSEYKNLRKDFIAQRKQLMLIQQKVSKKRQQLLEMKDTVENKKRLLQSTISMDISSLSPLPDTRDQPKQSSRASELLTLKFKEVCLKAQFAMMGLETASRPQAVVKMSRPAVKMSRPAEDLNLSPRKKMKLKARQPVVKAPLEPRPPSKIPKSGQSESADHGTSHKFVVSVRDKDKMDPLIPLCPYDIKGVCKDEECQYQHLKN